ncbi:MAG: DNA-processing protein DprA [Firmicutes bacterium]|nr:DNA-processing protein DprA [Bacillota bacterium]
MADRKKAVYVWYSLMRRLAPLQRAALLKSFGGAEEIYGRTRREIMDRAFDIPELSRAPEAAFDMFDAKDLEPAERIIDACEKKGIKILTFEDEEYPLHLAQIADPPVLLYALGDVSLIQRPCIAVVGTRKASPYGRWAAYEIGKRIAAGGEVVVSGMAEGIDARGHWGCIDGRGKTVAVLGTGVDVCFPSSNRELYLAIASGGLVLSEYLLGEWGRPVNFPVRNRIISGLSRAVIVVEGALKSGSMITAGLAAEQGRDVYAVPGNIDQPNSIGVNRLISDGAYPVFSFEDLSARLGLASRKKQNAMQAMSQEEKTLYSLLRQNPGEGCGFFAARTGRDSRSVRTLLMAMELKGLVRNTADRYYAC